MSNDAIVNILMAVLGCILIILVFLIIIYIVLKFKDKKNEKEEAQQAKDDTGNKDIKKSEKELTKESIFDFMEFEKIEDNMIIQKKGKFLMVIECQGINFDLMPEMEKVSVEQGFLEFLNALRYPIQLHIQTRTVNLEQSIRRYKEKLKVIEENYLNAKYKYEKTFKDVDASEKEKQKTYYDMLKQRNLYEYTKDIINNIEKTSTNSNVLNKKYYVIIPYYQMEMDTENYSKEEIQNMAFSELYTRAKTIINSLFSCQVSGKILDSAGLIELLYTAYNRDESDLFSVEQAMASGFEELYSTGEDIIEKKMKALDKEAERRAIELANAKIEDTKREKEYKKKKENLNNLVMELAQGMLEHDRSVIGPDIADEAMARIEKDKAKANGKNKVEEGEKNDVQSKGKKERPKRVTA